MDIAESLKTYLKTVTAITDLIGSGDNARIFFDQGRQGSPLPLIRLLENSGEGALEGLALASLSLGQSVFRVVASADGRIASNDLAEVIRVKLNRQGGVNFGDTFINEVSILAGRETRVTQPAAKGGDLVYEAAITYRIWHEVEAING